MVVKRLDWRYDEEQGDQLFALNDIEIIVDNYQMMMRGTMRS